MALIKGAPPGGYSRGGGRRGGGFGGGGRGRGGGVVTKIFELFLTKIVHQEVLEETEPARLIEDPA